MKERNIASLEKRLAQARDIETRYAQRAAAEPDNFALDLGHRSFQQEVSEVEHLLVQAQAEELARIRMRQEMRNITRKERLSAWSEYVNFAFFRLVAIAATVTGALELLDPEVLAIDLPISDVSFLGAGLAVLLYRPVLNWFRRLVEDSDDVRERKVRT